MLNEINEINEYLEMPIEGGSSSERAQNTGEVIGGYAANYSIGDNAIYNIRSNILDWKLLPKKTTQERKIQTVNDILNLGQFIENPKTLCAIIKEIYELPDADLIKALSKNLNLNESLEIALRKLYYVWMDLIEFVLVTLFELENIEVSPAISLTPNLKEFLNNLELENQDNKFYSTALFTKLKNYEHQGYCPCEPVKRINNIFTFPMDDVIKFIKTKNPSFMIGVDLNDIYHRFIDIIHQIDIENKKIIPAIKTRKSLPDITTNSVSNLDKMLNIYTDHFIDLYRVALPALKAQEKKYISLSKHIIEICNVVENIIITI